jgi:hypothetical protein
MICPVQGAMHVSTSNLHEGITGLSCPGPIADFTIDRRSFTCNQDYYSHKTKFHGSIIGNNQCSQCTRRYPLRPDQPPIEARPETEWGYLKVFERSWRKAASGGFSALEHVETIIT